MVPVLAREHQVIPPLALTLSGQLIPQEPSEGHRPLFVVLRSAYLDDGSDLHGVFLDHESVSCTSWGLFGLEGFTTAQDAISYRDAQDRADSIPVNGEEKALTLLKRAELSGDSILTKALLNRALEAGWVNVANSYIEANPYQGQHLEELWALQEPAPMSAAALQAQIVEEATFEVPKPDEISSYASDAPIEAIAKSDG